MNFYQIFLPIFTLIYILQIFVVKTIVQWKQTGTNPFVFGKTDNAHDYIGRVYKVMVLGTWVSIAFYSFFPKLYQYLLPFWYLDSGILRLTGLVVALASFIWIVIAQYQMARSWRIGINYEEKTELVERGVFAYFRNPIFLGMIVSYIGTFLIIPNVLSFSLLLVTYFVIQIQVRMEEEYLKEVHGKEYIRYLSKVRRWV
tara:strand:- start:1200 stop:1799 length:600 start_codon:yes stop_codon:yes gene_type:complete